MCLFPLQARSLHRESADLLAPNLKSHLNSRTLVAATPFIADGNLKKNVDFWIRIYTQYTTSQGLIHDSKYVDLVYEILDFSTTSQSSSKIIRESKKRWKKLLLSVHEKQKNPEKMNEEEMRVFLLFKDINESNKFVNAARRKRMRFQLGQKDRFIQGIIDSGKYLKLMEDIFRKKGLPSELTRLPFVESSFNLQARSRVGASGVWQFMRSTGRLFLKINDSVDERNDPIRATEAAAKLLTLNHKSLNSWPLAVTAYNHGRQGMMRAVQKVGTEDLEELINSYRSRKFGFASSNFYAELLAAIEVEKNAEKYFGKIARAEPLKFYEVELPEYIDLREIVSFLKLDVSQLRELNPGLTELTLSGRRLAPRGYFLRLPWDQKIPKEAAVRVFMAGYEQIPQIYKRRGQSYKKYGKGRPARNNRKKR